MYSTVLGAAIKCKQYSGITVESETPIKSVKITLNIFAVHVCSWYNEEIIIGSPTTLQLKLH